MATRKRAPSKKKAEKPVVTSLEGFIEEHAPDGSEVVEEAPAPIEQAANVIWRGDKEPPLSVRIGVTSIALPDAEKQRAGFFSSEANRLVRQINGYKFLKPLGTK